MRTLTKIKTLLVIQLLLLLTSYALKAQVDVLNKATEFYDKKQYDSASFYVDKATLHPETKEMAYTWYVKGASYLYLYHSKEKTNKTSKYRITALESFRKVIILDQEKEYLEDVQKSMLSLINLMQNDVAECMDPLEYETSIELFRKSQEYFRIINPSQDAYKAREIEFGLALGSFYYTVVESAKDSATLMKFFDLTKDIFMQVLSLDKNNISANYGIAILYYNQAVNLIKTSEYVDLTEIDALQNKSKSLFKTSLPYMETAESLDPDRIDTLEGLAGIWFALYDKTKFNNYQKKVQELKNKEK